MGKTLSILNVTFNPWARSGRTVDAPEDAVKAASFCEEAGVPLADVSECVPGTAAAVVFFDDLCDLTKPCHGLKTSTRVAQACKILKEFLMDEQVATHLRITPEFLTAYEVDNGVSSPRSAVT